tara:strand:+ start:25155 stop:25352 length:198 start_codon:yes stop_codon:yes gene_type:complete
MEVRKKRKSKLGCMLILLSAVVYFLIYWSLNLGNRFDSLANLLWMVLTGGFFALVVYLTKTFRDE